MANPQPDKFIKISTELIEAKSKCRISGSENQIWECVIRQTYGWQKKMDVISLSQFMLKTGMDKSRICKSIRKLVNRKMIVKKGNGDSISYGIQKNYAEWKPLSKKTTIVKKGNRHCPKGQKPLSKTTPTIDNKDTTTIDKRTRKFFVPSIKEISFYMKARCNSFTIANFEADKFYDHYESNGWFVGKNKMKDWQAAVRNWMRNIKSPQKPASHIKTKKREKIEDIPYDPALAAMIKKTAEGLKKN